MEHPTIYSSVVKLHNILHLAFFSLSQLIYLNSCVCLVRPEVRLHFRLGLVGLRHVHHPIHRRVKLDAVGKKRRSFGW